ncbi:hypothetical protein GMDG_07404 [Pseudogymnoascus destructans 20631-21]|uniref:Uncharacterized protein n=1 Tax=Pseudogymnoascus destructans (strain ATCC MYA-4855 / 20631-21) TaxID=658429 RepID=L8FX67_PSED2|nr:hypothetical protein GMDG_07404 [Pseudogymnoascus destructans 20631-21]
MAAEEEAAKKTAEEEAAKDADNENPQMTEEEKAAKKAADEEAAKKAAEEKAAKDADNENPQMTEEEKAAKKAAEEEAAKKAAEDKAAKEPPSDNENDDIVSRLRKGQPISKLKKPISISVEALLSPKQHVVGHKNGFGKPVIILDNKFPHARICRIRTALHMTRVVPTLCCRDVVES